MGKDACQGPGDRAGPWSSKTIEKDKWKGARWEHKTLLNNDFYTHCGALMWDTIVSSISLVTAHKLSGLFTNSMISPRDSFMLDADTRGSLSSAAESVASYVWMGRV